MDINKTNNKEHLAGTLFDYDEDDPDIQEDISDNMICKMVFITLDLPSLPSDTYRLGCLYSEISCHLLEPTWSKSQFETEDTGRKYGHGLRTWITVTDYGHGLWTWIFILLRAIMSLANMKTKLLRLIVGVL